MRAKLFAPLSFVAASFTALSLVACGGADDGTLTVGEHGYAPAPTGTGTSQGSGSNSTASTSGGADAGNGHNTGHDAGTSPPPPPPPPPPPATLGVQSLTLVDTSKVDTKGAPITGFDPIPNGATISLAKVGTELSIRANVGSAVTGSVDFVYGDTTTTDDAPPFVMCGDDGAGNITPCKLDPGTYTVVSRAYSGQDSTGLVGKTATVTFTITP